MIDTHCPNCNSRQRFAVKRRDLPDDVVEQYIYCGMCRTTFIISIASHKELKIRQNIARLHQRPPSESRSRRIRRQLTKLTEELHARGR